MELKFNILVLLVSFTVLGCSENPADNVIEAEVTEATNQIPKKNKAAKEADFYTFTDNSKIEFVGSKVTGSHKGGFNEFTGSFSLLDDKTVDPKGVHEIVIEMASCYSDHPKLTNHLKGPDFFDIEKYPQAKFQLISSNPISKDTYELQGTLTLHGMTKDIKFPAKIVETEQGIHFSAEFFIKRFDFGISYKGAADDLIRNEVVIRLDLDATPKGSANAAPGV